MPLNTMQTHTRDLLNGLAIPGLTDTLVCYVQPPVWEALQGPRAYVWGGRGSERRETMPRGSAFKRIDWMIDVYLAWLTSTENPTLDLDQAFPLLVDAVMAKLRTAAMVVTLQDPTTGVKSGLLAIGEQIDVEYPPAMTPESLRSLYYQCRLAAKMEERIQG